MLRLRRVEPDLKPLVRQDWRYAEPGDDRIGPTGRFNWVPVVRLWMEFEV